MARRFEYECVMCGNIREAKQPTRTCSPKCRKAYQRYIERGGEELDFRPIGEIVTPVTPESFFGVTPTPPAHEQAVNSYEPPPGYKLIEEQMHDVFMHMLMTRATDGEKKSNQSVTNQTAAMHINHAAMKQSDDDLVLGVRKSEGHGLQVANNFLRSLDAINPSVQKPAGPKQMDVPQFEAPNFDDDDDDLF